MTQIKMIQIKMFRIAPVMKTACSGTSFLFWLDYDIDSF